MPWHNILPWYVVLGKPISLGKSEPIYVKSMPPNNLLGFFQIYYSISYECTVFLELSFFFDDPAGVGNLISGSSAFSKSILNIWKIMVHALLKTCLENFENYFAVYEMIAIVW